MTLLETSIVTSQWVMTLQYIHCDITMSNDIARDIDCDITMGNDIARDIHCDITMRNDIAGGRGLHTAANVFSS